MRFSNCALFRLFYFYLNLLLSNSLRICFEPKFDWIIVWEAFSLNFCRTLAAGLVLFLLKTAVRALWVFWSFSYLDFSSWWLLLRDVARFFTLRSRPLDLTVFKIFASSWSIRGASGANIRLKNIMQAAQRLLVLAGTRLHLRHILETAAAFSWSQYFALPSSFFQNSLSTSWNYLINVTKSIINYIRI